MKRIAITALAALLLAGWLLIGPRVWIEGPVVRNGFAVVVVCGKVPQHRGICFVRALHLPNWHQREARQERAQDGQAQ